MKPIGTNAPRLTARSIVRFFCLTGKRHLFLTGGRGSGKTTLLNEILPLLSEQPVPGISTFAEKGKGVWLRENLSGEMAPIGTYNPLAPGAENRMTPVPEGFLTLGLSALKQGAEHTSPWFSVDEIGYLECGCEAYCDALRTLLEHKRLLGVVRKQDLPFLNELTHRPDVCIVDLDRPFGEIGCVIMASGLGQRFGGNKLMADFGGKPMISWILNATDGLFAHRIVVTRHRDVENFCLERNTEVVFHNLPHRSDTVRLGIEAIWEKVSGCLFCPGDQPLLSRETLQTMLLAAAHQPERIWQLSCGETPVSPVFFPQRFFEELQHLPEGKGGNTLAKGHPDLLSLVPAADPAEGIDVDTPEDLDQLTHIAAEAALFL